MDNVSFVESEMTFRMRAEMNIWESRHFFVINEAKAREKGWIK